MALLRGDRIRSAARCWHRPGLICPAELQCRGGAIPGREAGWPLTPKAIS